jgi:hypothetical protein
VSGWLKPGGIIVGAIIAGTGTAIVVSTRVWNRATARAVSRLRSLSGTSQSPAPLTFTRDQLAGLPAPVVRYFEFALTPGQPIVRRVFIRHAGEFRTRLGAPTSPFTSVQHVTTDAPGFVWDADIRMMPFIPTRVRDSYIGGEGTMHGAVAGLVPVVHQGGTPSIARGALVRYLAEAVWYPTALLPRRGLAWAAIDDSSARLTLTDGATTVWLDVRFGAQGQIERVSTVRDRDVKGVGVPTPWTAVNSRYERVAGMMIPMAGEVTWDLPEGPLTYWRGRIVETEYVPGLRSGSVESDRGR